MYYVNNVDTGEEKHWSTDMCKITDYNQKGKSWNLWNLYTERTKKLAWSEATVLHSGVF